MRSKPPSTLLVISPHLDDAVFSIGACIADGARRGAQVEVATLFAGTPHGLLSDVARDFHRRCALPCDGSAMTTRRNEDAAAVSVLGARYRHGDFLDAVFRTRSDGSWLCQHERGMFDRSSPMEDGLFSRLVNYIDWLCLTRDPDTIATCVGIGSHVDHRLTREAVLTVVRRRDLRLWFWEDLPYALDPAERWPHEVATAKACESRVDSWQQKWDAVARYSSQLRMLWGAADWQRLLSNPNFRDLG